MDLFDEDPPNRPDFITWDSPAHQHPPFSSYQADLILNRKPVDPPELVTALNELVSEQQSSPHGSDATPIHAKTLPVILTVDRFTTLPGFLHFPPDWADFCRTILIPKTAVIMLPNHKGGLLGPSGVYPDV